MKIVYFTHYTDLYGANKSLIEIVTNMSKKGVNPVVISPGFGELNKELNKLNIENYCFDYECWVKSTKSTFIKNILLYVRFNIKNVIAIKKINKLINRLDVDLIHSNSSVINIGAIIAKKQKLPHIWHIREFGKEDYNIEFYKSRNKAIKFILDNSSQVICISNSIKQSYFKNMDDKKINVIYNAVETDFKENKCIKNEGRMNIIFVGNVMENKNQMEAIKALNSLDSNILEHVHLDIVGSGDEIYINKLKDYINKNKLVKNVNFLGHIKNVSDIYQNYEIGIISSVKEGFGRVTIEYMSNGIIPIASNTGANVEIVKNNENGFIYELGNHLELAKIITLLYNDKKLRIDMNKISKKYVRDNFSIERLISELLEIYTKLT